jgi:hypothetical protein
VDLLLRALYRQKLQTEVANPDEGTVQGGLIGQMAGQNRLTVLLVGDFWRERVAAIGV